MADLEKMIATLDDKSDGLPTLDKSITTLINAGYDKALIAKFVDKAHARQYAVISGNGCFRPKHTG